MEFTVISIVLWEEDRREIPEKHVSHYEADDYIDAARKHVLEMEDKVEDLNDLIIVEVIEGTHYGKIDDNCVLTAEDVREEMPYGGEQ